MFKVGDVVLINGEMDGRVFSNHIGTVVDCLEDCYTVEIYGYKRGWGIDNNKWNVKHYMVSKQVEASEFNVVIKEDDIKYEHPKPIIQTYGKGNCPYNIESYGIKKLIIAEPHVIGIDEEGNEFISTCCREDTFDLETGINIMCLKKERYDSERKINLIRREIGGLEREIREFEREIRSEERVIKNIDDLIKGIDDLMNK